MAVRKVSARQYTKQEKSDQQQHGPSTLGKLIAAVLAHPDTPKNLFEAMGTAICDLQNHRICDRPEFIQVLLDLNKKYGKPEEKEGGAH